MVGAPVVIVGAGFAGLSLASRLSQAGRECVLLERRSALPREGGAVVIQANGLAALERIGALDALLTEALPIERTVMRSPRGRDLARYSYAELGAPHPYIVSMLRSRILHLLVDALGPTVSVRTGCEAIGVTREGDGRVDGVRYRSSSGEQHAPAAWVVGADGGGSRIRDAIGSRLVARSGPYPYLVGVSPHMVPERRAVLYMGPGWADGVIPMRDGTDFWDNVTAENRVAVEARNFEEWRRVYRRRVPIADELLDGLSSLDDLSLLVGRTHRAVPRSAHGAVLAGDAAAAVHPHSGQGANLALVDGVGLGDALLDGRPEAVAAHTVERDRRMRLLVPYSRLIGLTFDAPNPLWRLVRMESYAVARLPPLRRALLRRGAGLA